MIKSTKKRFWVEFFLILCQKICCFSVWFVEVEFIKWLSIMTLFRIVNIATRSSDFILLLMEDLGSTVLALWSATHATARRSIHSQWVDIFHTTIVWKQLFSLSIKRMKALFNRLSKYSHYYTVYIQFVFFNCLAVFAYCLAAFLLPCSLRWQIFRFLSGQPVIIVKMLLMLWQLFKRALRNEWYSKFAKLVFIQ